jgi:hypothetical protein
MQTMQKYDLNISVLKPAKGICGCLYIRCRPPLYLAVLWISKYFFPMDPDPRIRKSINYGSGRMLILSGYFCGH